ncbi:MAG: arsenate reductase ArsC [Planctomycetes bacterium]|nr:arsenate reductase ArsC [Planctomycetota bacterium]MCB9936332.1 arsenate reductase ArsC [Planctomycetota bacterium]
MSWQQDIEQIRKLNPKHILFLCVQNSARSQLAEGVARKLAPPGVRVSSAGSQPAFVRPLAIEALAEIGVDAGAHTSKSIADVDASSVDVVITLCAEEVCPVFPHPVHKFHWPLPDPAKEGTLETFRNTRDELQKRLSTLFA